jgi:hypothetical protein
VRDCDCGDGLRMKVCSASIISSVRVIRVCGDGFPSPAESEVRKGTAAHEGGRSQHNPAARPPPPSSARVAAHFAARPAAHLAARSGRSKPREGPVTACCCCSDTSLCRLPALSADQPRHSIWRIRRPQTHFGGLSRWTGQPGPRHLARTHEDPNHCVSQ